MRRRQQEMEAQMHAKAQEEEKEREKAEREETKKQQAQAQRDITLFHKMKIGAMQALKSWAVNTTKEAIEMIPPSIDEKFNEPNPEHRWQRFSIRFKLLLYSFTEEASTMPAQMHNFLNALTLGKLRIPPGFLLDFEKSQLSHVIGLDRKLKLPHEIPEIQANPSLL